MGGKLYKRLWRWHFWAAFLVIPFVLLQGISGTLYVWANEWADWAHPTLRFAPPSPATASAEEQVNAALAAVLPVYPGATAATLLVPEDPARSHTVLFDAANGLQIAAFINPHTAEVLGVLGPWEWLPGWTRAIHGGWPLGKPGSWLLELGASWCIVMILTGLYLWWPRGIGFGRALVPRLGQGQRVFWRDLHACVAVWFSILTLGFLVTALPWTDVWGNQVLKPAQQLLNQSGPGFGAKGLKSVAQEGVEPMSLDEAITLARAKGLRGPLELRLSSSETEAMSLRNRLPQAADEQQLAADRYSRQVLRHTTWADYKTIPRVVATGVDLHEGTYFGRANQWLNSLLSAALAWVSVTGLVSWYLRRPAKAQLAAPPKVELQQPRWLTLAALGLCLFLPLLGLSVLLLLLLDTLTQPLWPQASRP